MLVIDWKVDDEETKNQFLDDPRVLYVSLRTASKHNPGCIGYAEGEGFTANIELPCVSQHESDESKS